MNSISMDLKNHISLEFPEMPNESVRKKIHYLIKKQKENKMGKNQRLKGILHFTVNTLT